MENRQRLLFLAIAAAIAVVAVVVLAGGSGDEGSETAATPTATATATASPADDNTDEPTPTATATQEPTPEAAVIEIEGGKVSGGEAEIEAKQGETVRLAVSSDADDELHVHGYEIKKPVEAGKVARISFKADIPGVFEIELENTHLQVARLKIEP